MRSSQRKKNATRQASTERPIIRALEGHRATERDSAWKKQHELIASLGQIALIASDTSELIVETIHRLAESLDVELAAVLELLPDETSMRLHSGIGWAPGLIGHARISAGPDSPAGLALLADEPILIADVAHDVRFKAPALLRDHGVRSTMTVAIAGERRLFGALGIYSRRRRDFTLDEINLVRAVANILAGKIKEQRLQQALRDSEARVRAIVNTLVDGIITIDERGIIGSLNPAAEKLFGYPAAEMIGRNVSTLMPDPYRANHDQYVRNYLRTGTARIIGIGREVIGCRKDGTTFPMELSVSELNVGGQRMFTGIARDITERRRLEREVLDAGTEEQRRIGQDLHDGLCQHLTGIAFATEVLSRKLTARAAPEAAALGQIAEMIDQSMTQARELARGLQPVHLEAGGLPAVLEALAGSVTEMFRISCLFVSDGPCLVHDAAMANHLYRIAQEAVSNAVKHGKARTVIIELSASDEQLRLVITDDGIGISNAGSDGKGIGLKTMDYRARLIGSEFDVRSGEHGGTIVTCIVRLPKIDSEMRMDDGEEGGQKRAVGNTQDKRSRRGRSSHRSRAPRGADQPGT